MNVNKNRTFLLSGLWFGPGCRGAGAAKIISACEPKMLAKLEGVIRPLSGAVYSIYAREQLVEPRFKILKQGFLLLQLLCLAIEHVGVVKGHLGQGYRGFVARGAVDKVIAVPVDSLDYRAVERLFVLLHREFE